VHSSGTKKSLDVNYSTRTLGTKKLLWLCKLIPVDEQTIRISHFIPGFRTTYTMQYSNQLNRDERRIPIRLRKKTNSYTTRNPMRSGLGSSTYQREVKPPPGGSPFIRAICGGGGGSGRSRGRRRTAGAGRGGAGAGECRSRDGASERRRVGGRRARARSSCRG
jgi:hypothetical protein